MGEQCARTEPLQSAWLDGALDSQQRDVVARHLQDCGLCRRDLRRLQAVRSLLRSLPVRRPPKTALPRPAHLDPRVPPGTGGARLGEASALGWRRLTRRAVAGAAMVLGLLGAAAFALGGDPAVPRDRAGQLRTVRVPMEVYVADHLVRAVGGPLSTPMLLEARQ
ncbi:MAG TPA: zf-HC2 domain-containing protein [Egibacteraceae bacterium]|nr:zf-HC2 domain-containing protein [Egibacteraceae bacterium]